MKTALICHEDEEINRQILPQWLASFSDLAVIVSIKENRGPLMRRVKREIKRTGWLRFADVVAFRLYYRLTQAARDAAWEREEIARLSKLFPEVPASTRVIHVESPNQPEVAALLREISPDVIIARCKWILKEKVFGAARTGTFVLHPGICPEYRNAHGCFWALARRDLSRVGMTLLRVDPGVDTGPVFGYFTCSYDELRESHAAIQLRMVFDNLDAIRDRLIEIEAGVAQPVDTTGRSSRVWGQPWLSEYLRWKREARRHADH